MDRDRWEEIGAALLRGEINVAQFAERAASTAHFGVAQLEVASVDLDRQRRCGFPEVVFGQGKTNDSLVAILRALIARGADGFATRINPEQAAHLQGFFPDGAYNALGRTFRVPGKGSGAAELGGVIVIITAGTSDLPIAEEARETALWMGADVRMIHDVGVAGPHRLPAHLDKLADADAVVVIAGMEGALPSVVGGYVNCPVVGVPTSVGYGASFGGLSALLGMLNSCASNVTVVNIDSGFKGAYVAGLIAKNAAQARQRSER
jgi:NCAIR mutase (PurE)-related protein